MMKTDVSLTTHDDMKLRSQHVDYNNCARLQPCGLPLNLALNFLEKRSKNHKINVNIFKFLGNVTRHSRIQRKTVKIKPIEMNLQGSNLLLSAAVLLILAVAGEFEDEFQLALDVCAER